MNLEKRQPSGREKDEASIELLEKLRGQLYSSNISIVRQSAFRLSWMQEDGLEILREALLGDAPRQAKGAAAYGLRKMRGRMRKRAEQTLIEGAAHPDPATAQICRNALTVIKKNSPPAKQVRRAKGKPPGKFEIREIRSKTHGRKQQHKPRRPGGPPRSHRR
ncbi:MAG: hypothetical protein KBE65_18105 [Phycisphaerae bacterium]|nr:hypothetical protein [Phycisphaerae bacterium]